MNIKFILLAFLFSIATAISTQPPIGSQCPEISLTDVDGNTVKLSSLQGKVVVIDFWASWCGPCRVANRTLRKIYTKYHDKGLEIYSISCDYTMSPWKKAIIDDKITWLQVFDEANMVSNKWHIGYLPFTFLLDRTGKIVAADVDIKHLEGEVKKLL